MNNISVVQSNKNVFIKDDKNITTHKADAQLIRRMRISEIYSFDYIHHHDYLVELAYL